MSKNLNEAIDFAISNGLLKYNSSYELTHAPFSLTPFSVRPELHRQMAELTPLCNRLWMKIAADTPFLREALEKTAATDSFIANLLTLLPEGNAATEWQLLISRNDFLLEPENETTGIRQPRQVEFNTISNSFLALSRQVSLLHHHLHLKGLLPCPPLVNDPLEAAVDTMARVIKSYGGARNCMLMVVQQPEQNIFDQRIIEYRLLEKHKIQTVRMTLEEIAEKATLENGRLQINGQTAALTYFRAGYTPADYKDPASWRARALIESSATVKCPTVGMQLAGAKKIQQLLGDPKILERYLEAPSRQKVAETFAGMYTLDETVDGITATEAARQSPHRFVLKPQREGGGNNLYGQEMRQRLDSLSASEKEAFILMERIAAVSEPAALVVESFSEVLPAISEIGRYGICLAEGNKIIENRDIGYLVRTKSADKDEGGVCAGYACLNSLCLAS